MKWTVETVSPGGAAVCRLSSDQAGQATLLFETPRRSKVLIGDLEYHIVDKDGFFRRDVRLIAPSGTVEIAATVGWSGRMWWMLPDDHKLFYDYSPDWNHHRVVLRGADEVMRLLPRYNGKKLAGCEVRGHIEETLWSLFAFYLMIYDERESLDAARQWSELGKGLSALTLEGAAAALFEA